jgi:hypothetical protein
MDNTDEQHKKKILQSTINSMIVKITVINNKNYTALFIISYSIFTLRIRFRSAIGICKWFDRWTVMSSNRFFLERGIYKCRRNT